MIPNDLTIQPGYEDIGFDPSGLVLAQPIGKAAAFTGRQRSLLGAPAFQADGEGNVVICQNFDVRHRTIRIHPHSEVHLLAGRSRSDLYRASRKTSS